jgi:hypothetical protein
MKSEGLCVVYEPEQLVDTRDRSRWMEWNSRECSAAARSVAPSPAQPQVTGGPPARAPARPRGATDDQPEGDAAPCAVRPYASDLTAVANASSPLCAGSLPTPGRPSSQRGVLGLSSTPCSPQGITNPVVSADAARFQVLSEQRQRSPLAPSIFICAIVHPFTTANTQSGIPSHGALR